MAPSEWQSSNVPPSMTPTQRPRPSSRTPSSTNLPVPPKGNGNEDKFSEFFPHLPSLPSIIQAIGHKLEGPFWLDVCKALQRAGYPDFLPPQIVDFCKGILHESTTLQHTTTQTAKPNPITPTPHPTSLSPSSTAVPTTLSSVVSTSSNSPSGCDFSSSCTGPIGNGTFSGTTSSHHPPDGSTSGSPSTHDPSSSTGPTVSSSSLGPSSGSGSPSGSPPPTTDPPSGSSTPSSPISTQPIEPPGDSANSTPGANRTVTTINISSPSDALTGDPTPTESSTDSVTPTAFPIQSTFKSRLSSESTQEPASSPSRLPSLPPTSSVSISFPGGTSQTTTQVSAHYGSGTPGIFSSTAITPSSSSSSNRSSASSSFFSRTSTVVGTFTAVGVVVAAAAVGVLVLFHLRRRPGKHKRHRDSQLVPQVDPDGIPKNDVANGAGKGSPMRQASTQTNSSGRSLTSRNSTLPILPELEEIRPEDPFATMVPPLIQSPRHSRRSWNNAPDDVDPIDPDFVWSSNDDSSDSMVSTRSTTRMTTPERLVSDPETRAAMGWILADERSLTPVEEEEDEQALLSSRRPGR